MRELNYSTQLNEELINCYEKLRDFALNKSKDSVGNYAGYSVILFRGVPAWINAYLSSELNDLIQSSHIVEVTSNIVDQHINFPQDINNEAMMILTNMVLSHQQNDLRNSYVRTA